MKILYILSVFVIAFFHIDVAAAQNAVETSKLTDNRNTKELVCDSVTSGIDKLMTNEAVPSDSITGYDCYNDLAELVVTGKRVVRRGNVLLLFPTKRDKKFAMGGIDILDNMGIGDVLVNPIDKSVKIDGDIPSMFIDFVPASSQDLVNVRPNDVERIDVIRNPKDPRFQGVRIAVNYIMKKYQYGGYTKLDGKQTFIYNSGNYNLYSKFSHGHMTYDISAGDSYESEKHNEHKSINEYWFDNNVITSNGGTDKSDRFINSPYVTGRVTYSGSKAMITNQLGFKLSSVSKDKTHGWKSYSYNPVDLLTFHTNNTSLSRNYKWDGDYYFPFSNGYSMSFNGKVSWDENITKASYDAGPSNIYINDISERAFDAMVGLSGTKQFGNHSLSLQIAGEYNRNSLDYLGTANSRINYENPCFNGRISGNFSFGRFFFSPSLWIAPSFEKFNGNTISQLLWGAFAYGQCALPRNNSVFMSLEYSICGVPASERSPVVMIQDEVSAVAGNENVKNWRMGRAMVGYSKPIGNWLSCFGNVQYNFQNNPVIAYYTPSTIDGLNFMLRTFTNDGFFQNTHIECNLIGRFFDRRLSVQVGGMVDNFMKSGMNSYNFWMPHMTAKVTFYAGNFSFSAYYQSEIKRSGVGSIINKYPYLYSFWVNYSAGDLKLQLLVPNIFTAKYDAGTSVYNSSAYSYRTTNYSNEFHQYIQLSATWSFGYGKKIDRRDEVQAISGGESIILK